MKILISDPIDDQAVEELNKEFDNVEVKTNLSIKELNLIIKNYNILVVRSKTQVNKELLENTTNLKLIVRAGVGVDNIDLDTASNNGIYVMNCPSGNSIAVAEHTIGLMLALSRNITFADSSMKSGKWEKKLFQGNELNNKTLGIIGLGRIGCFVASIAKSFSMDIIALDPFIKKEKADALGIKLVDKDRLIKDSDYISIHTALTPETKNLISKKEFSKMKNTSFIINSARGGIINESDLFDALKNNVIKGAALDVFETEPNINKKLLDLSNVIVTPHIGGNTIEAQAGLGKMVAHQIINAVIHNKYENVVNLPYKDIQIDPKYYPFLTLAQRIGKLHYSLLKNPVTTIKLEIRGEISKISKKLSVFVLKGFLENFLDITINEVNAFIIAKQRNIKIIEETGENSTVFKNLLRVRVECQNNESLYINGTTFGEKYLRIVKLGDYITDFYPDGNILVVENNDVPGVIGNVGTMLGENSINIGEWRQGKNQKVPGLAMGVINLDSKLPIEVFDKIKKLPNIVNANYIEM